MCQRSSPTPAEWEQHREIITRLWRDEDKTRNEICKIMRDKYQFHATPKMYQRRTSKWGLDKKRKHTEMIFAYQIIEKRLLEGKTTKITIRGQEVSYADVQRYCKRRPFRDLQLSSDITMDDCPQDVRVHTPRPNRSNNQLQRTSLQSQSEDSQNNIIAVRSRQVNSRTRKYIDDWDTVLDSLNSSQGPSPPCLPYFQQFISIFDLYTMNTENLDCFDDSQRAMLCLRNHLREFRDDTMIGWAGASGNEAFSLVKSAVEHYHFGNSKYGKEDLEAGFDQIQGSLGKQGPKLLLRFLNTLDHIYQLDTLHLPDICLRFTYNMAKKLLGSNHPFTTLVSCLHRGMQVRPDLLPHLNLEILRYIDGQAACDLSLKMYAFSMSSSGCVRMKIEFDTEAFLQTYKRLLDTCDRHTQQWFYGCLHIFHACIDLHELTLASEMMENMRWYIRSIYGDDIPAEEAVFLAAHDVQLLYKQEEYHECYEILQHTLDRYAGLLPKDSMRVVALKWRISMLFHKGYTFDFSACPELGLDSTL